MAALTVLLLATLALARSAYGQPSFDDTMGQSFNEMVDSLEDHQKGIQDLARQLSYNRFRHEERVRSEGNSGLVHVRHVKAGSLDFHNDGLRADQDLGGMHDHGKWQTTMGFGKVGMVMNGVYFYTRHTDYTLSRAHTTDTTFHKTEPIELPPVPEAVLNKTTLEEQMDEMAEFFHAFNTQNYTHRDYRNYFKPALCYIEGKWLKDPVSLEIIPDLGYLPMKAEDWKDVHTQNYLDSQTGTMYFNDERTPYLPREIISLDETGMPIYGQWHYRILCHPIQKELSTVWFREVDDLSYRIPHEIPIEDLRMARGTRFTLDSSEGPDYFEGPSLLDEIVGEIPGLDNAPQYIKEQTYLGRKTYVSEANQTELNLGFYNRRYYDANRDVGKRFVKYRGFSDMNVFVAHNTQPEVAPMNMSFVVNQYDKRILPEIRLSWAIPLEVVYMHPLLSWNPHGITFTEDDVTEGANGTEAFPYTGMNKWEHLMTPAAMYENTHRPPTSASSDDFYGFTYVKNSEGEPVLVTASGIQMTTPPLRNGRGSVRIRYPIVPVHQEGSMVWKELNALKVALSQEVARMGNIFASLQVD